MKPWRIWLLLVLALLLPVRGALAAAMLCPPAAHAQGAEEHAHHGEDDVGGGAHQDRCTLCASFCSVTPLLSDVAGVVEPQDLVHVHTTEPGARAPNFLSDGQERPPRSI